MRVARFTIWFVLLSVGLSSAAEVPSNMNRARVLEANYQYREAAELYRRLAESGLPDASLEYGIMILNGRVEGEDGETAWRFFERALSQGGPEYRARVGIVAGKGLGTLAGDPEHGKTMIRQAMSAGYDDGYFALACIDNGKEHQGLLEKGVELGEVSSLYALGHRLMWDRAEERRRKGIEMLNASLRDNPPAYIALVEYHARWSREPDAKEARRLLGELEQLLQARNDCRESRIGFLVGDFYSRHADSEADMAKARQWYEWAMHFGNGSDYVLMGERHENGDILPVDIDKARECYRKAIDVGYLDAYRILAQSHLNGDNPDPLEAMRVYEEGLEKARSLRVRREVEAVYDDIIDLNRKNGKRPDLEQAYVWMRKKAEELGGNAYGHLGLALLRGRDVRQNPQEAGKWLELAFAEGDYTACCEAADIFWNGEMVSRDYANAKIWFERCLEIVENGVDGGAQAARRRKHAGEILATMHAEGLGTPVNPEMSRRYATLAATVK